MAASIDPTKTSAYVEKIWDEEIVPQLTEYIKIPNKSPSFDPDWKAKGHMDRAVALIEGWCRKQPIEGLTVEVIEHEGRTPVIFMEVPPFGADDASVDTVLLYGHLDKQPEMIGWAEDLGPWKPVQKGDKLYGRGGADDGYAAFGSLTAIAALQKQGVPHARCVIIIEGSEESGSPDLPHYIDALADRIGSPSLVVCLDSGCGDYEHLWCTTSLRGMVIGELSVELIREGVHSGSASGVVASSFRVVRQLLSRIEDENTGEVLVDALKIDIPQQRREQAEVVAKIMGETVWKELPLHEGVQPVVKDPVEALLNRTWRATVSITGASGLPTIEDGGNVLRPKTSVKVSMRLPPTCDPRKAYDAVKATLEKDPPYGAKVSFSGEHAEGWNAPPLAEWLEKSLDEASKAFFNTEAAHMGEGGSIPFMGMLGEKFPEAQFMITGVLGPQSNAHGPNEFLHIPTGKRVTCAVAKVLEDHLKRRG